MTPATCSHPAIPPLWSDDEVEVREDGFLLVKSDAIHSEMHDEDVQQPLLLHSTEVFLKALYPSVALHDILSFWPNPIEEKTARENETTAPAREQEEQGIADAIDEFPMDIDTVQGTNDENDKAEDIDNARENMADPVPSNTERDGKNKDEKSSEGVEYMKVYQNLKRTKNLANQVAALTLDLATFRHRPIKGDRDGDRSKAKVRALEQQQKQLLKSQSAEVTACGEIEKEVEIIGDERDPRPNKDDSAAESSAMEPQVLRMVRTINSIRAVCPHLLQMFNHKRRNDRGLKIGSVAWKSKKRGFCWLLGTKVFDCSSSRIIISCYQDLVLILKGFLWSNTVHQISQDPLGGSFHFWTKEWIPEVLAKANASMVDPVTILTNLPARPSRKAMLKRMVDCDEELHLDGMDASAADIHAKYDAAVQELHTTISGILKSRFPEARVSIYGSCLSNLSLGRGADVDLSLWLPEAHRIQTDFQGGRIGASKFEKQMKQFVYQVFHKLNNRGHEFRDMQPVTRARVPVVKGTYNLAQNPYSNDGSIKFDICFLNDIAVANSGLMREYSTVDPRVRKVMMAVKLWAKEHRINSAQFNCISSYAWINLVIFYLQCIGFLPNLQSPELMKSVGFVPDPQGNIWHSVNKLDTWYLKWEQVRKANAWSLSPKLEDVSVSALLYGFFEFYSERFPRAVFSISIKQGNIQLSKLAFNKARLFFSIEDPFETYDSHCPHDLGIPATENGTRRILMLLHQAEDYLRKILYSDAPLDNFWPNAPTVTNDAVQKARYQVWLDDKAEHGNKQQERSPGTGQGSSGNFRDGNQGRGSGGRKGGGVRRGGRGRGRGGRGSKSSTSKLPNNRNKEENAGAIPASKSNEAESKDLAQSKRDSEHHSTNGQQPQNTRKGNGKIQGPPAFSSQEDAGTKTDGPEQAKSRKKHGKRNRKRNTKTGAKQPEQNETKKGQNVS